jgi:hypothetical protein
VLTVSSFADSDRLLSLHSGHQGRVRFRLLSLKRGVPKSAPGERDLTPWEVSGLSPWPFGIAVPLTRSSAKGMACLRDED